MKITQIISWFCRSKAGISSSGFSALGFMSLKSSCPSAGLLLGGSVQNLPLGLFRLSAVSCSCGCRAKVSLCFFVNCQLSQPLSHWAFSLRSHVGPCILEPASAWQMLLMLGSLSDFSFYWISPLPFVPHLSDSIWRKFSALWSHVISSGASG